MSPSVKKAIAAAPTNTKYIVKLKRGTAKGLIHAGDFVHALLEDLMRELAVEGPVQAEWPHFRQLKGLKGQPKTLSVYHCHLKSGNPTYVAVWEVTGTSITIDVTYTGPHEKAPYAKNRLR